MPVPTSVTISAGIQFLINLGVLPAQAGANVSLVPAGASANGPLSIGSTAGKVNGVYSKVAPNNAVVPSSVSALALTLSALNDPNADNTAFLHIAYILVENLSTAQTLTVKPGASNGVTFLSSGGIILPPSSSTQSTYVLLAIPLGAAIVASTSDTLQIMTDGGTNVPCNVIIIGRNA